MKKLKVIYQDQRIADEFCNFCCEYCGGFYPSKYSLKKDKQGNLNVESDWYDKVKIYPIEIRKHFKYSRTMKDFFDVGLEIINKTKDIIECDILKISGGEITVNENLVDFVRNIHKYYESIQILTNGFNIKEKDLKEYKKMKNVCFQVSIDGATADSNYGKSHSSTITEKVLKNIELMIKEKIGVEINCVLTKYNTDRILAMLERFKTANNFIIIPRPVRGAPKKILNFTQKQIEIFEKTIMENFDKYENILPPKAYLKRLIEIMKKDKRESNCYIPYFVQSVDSYGNLEDCPIGLITSVNCNVFLLDKRKKLFVKDRDYGKISLCQNCTNQYEMFNLYVEGKITEKELKKLPSLNNEKIIADSKKIKEEIIKKQIHELLLKNYGIEAKQITKNEESTEGNVYNIKSQEKKYIAKIYDDIEHTRQMSMLFKKVVSVNLNVPKIIKNNKNDTYQNILGNNYLVLYEFITGKAIRI